MANTLNNFGLAELTLKTANKWCTANIDVKIDSAELENIKPEYLRSGAEVFGVTGNYGDVINNVTIPAGIYEVIPDFENCEVGDSTTITIYQSKALCTGLYVSTTPDEDAKLLGFTSTGSFSPIAADPEEAYTGTNTLLDYLVYVPQDTVVSLVEAKFWYSQMHPYVSCRDPYTKQELSAIELADQIIPPTNCEHLGDRTYIDNDDGSTHQVICNQCSEVLNYSESHEYNEGYCWCGASSGSTCEHTNWVYYEESWTDHSSEYDNAQYECRCSSCQCNFRVPHQGDTWPNCPCCGSAVEYIGYVGGDDSGNSDGGGGDSGNTDGGDSGNEYYCTQCSYPVNMINEYEGYCTENNHYNNFHDPEYCSHDKISWQCKATDCWAEGTCCAWDGDDDYRNWISNGICPRCQTGSIS